jgi:hypothetical protein
MQKQIVAVNSQVANLNKQVAELSKEVDRLNKEFASASNKKMPVKQDVVQQQGGSTSSSYYSQFVAARKDAFPSSQYLSTKELTQLVSSVNQDSVNVDNWSLNVPTDDALGWWRRNDWSVAYPGYMRAGERAKFTSYWTGRDPVASIGYWRQNEWSVNYPRLMAEGEAANQANQSYRNVGYSPYFSRPSY